MNQNKTNSKVPTQGANESTGSRNDNIIFIVCMVIAALFWVLIKLSDTYTENFVFKVNYVNVPPEKQLTRLADSTLSINIDAQGFSILKLQMFQDDNVIDIDLDEIDIIKNDGNNYLIYTQELKPYFAEIYQVEENDFSFSKTTLGFTLEKLQSKKLMVRENHELDFKTQYDMYEPSVISPEVITVFGPKDILDTMQFVRTEGIKLNGLDENKSVSVGLINPIPSLLHFDPEIVTMNIRVEKFTEKTIDVVIDFSSINAEIKSFPETAKVNFKIAQKDFNLAQPSQFSVKPETEGVDISNADKLQLKLVHQPDYIRNAWIVPTEVEFLIIK